METESELRLECLRLACSLDVPAEQVKATAMAFYDFVVGQLTPSDGP